LQNEGSENLILDEKRKGITPKKLHREGHDVCCSDGAELIGKCGSPPKEAHVVVIDICVLLLIYLE
jgi:hypothetical protein